jgi:hypothetical protein
VTGAETSLVITAVVTGVATLLTSIAGFIKVLRRQDQTDNNVQRLEQNTNSISERNEAIAKKLGIAEGKQLEKDNPS